MIEAVSRFDPVTASGLLARAALSVEDEGNPAAEARLPEESRIRRAVVDEVRARLGISADDYSASSIERMGEAIDAEMESLTESTDTAAVLEEMARKGQLPSDLYDIQVIPNVRDLYQKRWYQEQDLIQRTVREADREQHFGPVSRENEPVLVSLFAKYFPAKYPFRSFTLLVVGQRDGRQLIVHQAWHLYADEVAVTGAKEVLDLLRRFSDVFGLLLNVDGVESRFVVRKDVAPGAHVHVNVLPITKIDGRGRKVEAAVHSMVSHFTMTPHGPDAAGRPSASLTLAIDLDKYLATLDRHQWSETVTDL